MEEMIIDKQYWAVFDIDTRKISGIYPSHSVNDISNKVKIDDDLVKKIHRGEVQLINCYVDLDFSSLSVINDTSNFDDNLYKIPEKLIFEKKMSEENKISFDILIVYHKEQKIAEIKVNEHLRTTVCSKQMNFIFSNYNDPNIWHHILSVNINDKNTIFYDVELPTQFSVFTKRIFKKYILEIV